MLLKQEKGSFKNSQEIIFVFWEIMPQKNRFWKFWIKKECFVDHKKEVFKNSNPWKFFKAVSPWFWSKYRTFYHVCFLAKLSTKRSLFDILNKHE